VAWSLPGAVVAALEEQQAHAGGEMTLGALAVALHALGGFVDDDSLGGWNDAPRRAHGEVEAALTAAAVETAAARRLNRGKDRARRYSDGR